MRIVAIADTHGKHRKVSLPDGDVLVHAGDWTNFGSGRDDFLEWFEDQPFEHRVLILGNHEGGSLSSVSKHRLEAELEQREPITYIGHRTVAIDGLVFGSRTAEKAPDVLVTHQPPKNVMDAGQTKHWPEVDLTSRALDSPIDHYGSEAVRELVRDVQPNLHIFGHVHRSYGRGVDESIGTQFINCALAGEDYEPVNDPVIIELEAK